MLVPFTVDPDIFSNKYNQDELYRHETLIDLWEKFGCLVLTGKSDSNSSFLSALRQAPPQVKLRWQNALKQLRQKKCGIVDFDPKDSESISQWLAALADHVQIVSLESTRALRCGVPEDKYSLAQEQAAEICRFGHELQSVAFKRACNLAQMPIEKGTPWNKVWTERIEPFALQANTIFVVDRYALTNFFENNKGFHLSGLERLIMQLSGLKKENESQCNLHLIASIPKDGKEKWFEASIQKIRDFKPLLKGNALREIRVYAINDSEFGKINHHRYIRFDAYNLLELNIGIELLDGDTVNRICTTNLLSWRQEACKPYKDAEKELKAVKGFDETITF